ncbi:MAG: 4a-hydroxytetrahydrobiopterin dehydratase [Bacteroidetes bacterium]|jgi:4a-hydroxytetrahydrobiopterin dehydratase|nr:4a-hydroxytetrahydrobiopterin dehydratase [Bacteroidota bacterium]MBP7255817.1 4a-hydroxytetrahydrobiopterin dehydratase [Chitinophagales bacterium]MBK7139711.1 4a-hydroxytetrahydrobiopterin dehydratase [Bacteroidota bacterium]MBK7506061.1 4a-hydroxytetrahydrobiopterin dehydratase [Bacteroidota bacterium]MBK7639563.1 4a-hydroxytetrahydrobiopterin dehydratase [Bacteroidota bacterium]
MWAESNNKLFKKFVFTDFTASIAFINKIALLAEKENHHPEIYNIYNIVEIRLQTHDAGNKITEKDRNLAAEIDKLI